MARSLPAVRDTTAWYITLMLRRSLVLLAIASLAWLANASPAGAATSGPPVFLSLQRTCANRAEMVPLAKRVAEADAVQDEQRFELHRELAREYYRCSKTHSQRDWRDYATMAYIFEMLNSVDLDALDNLQVARESRSRAQLLEKQCNDLAASARLPDIRSRARQGRDQLRKFEGVIDKIIAQLEGG